MAIHSESAVQIEDSFAPKGHRDIFVRVTVVRRHDGSITTRDDTCETSVAFDLVGAVCGGHGQRRIDDHGPVQRRRCEIA